ncbi:cation-translocating P-type ATPase [Microbacterium thalassium]|uniref:Ca2+-transporting ATPase n=1 Tax=Microbacterium thalassium TaxID=362649 RepID=A0A7X0FPY9_9MICO|nr:HAD-IC family P-type ATPase [Microbacterium thalassium]MBB6391557.1 Ca2+-transporting ATPase [Microbacterium thalassium]GLK24049.1 putative cation-transporting ATPase F [Microbacterium thalassium]
MVPERAAAPASGWCARDVPTVCAELGASVGGLSPEDAADRLARWGPNALPAPPPTPWWVVLARQFISPLIAILIVAGIVTSIQRHWVDAGAIFLVLALNAALGFWQERKAARDVRALQELATTSARVRRGGVVEVIPAEDVVPGDLVLVESGDRVPADARLVEVNALLADESLLTGESLAVLKGTAPVAADTAVADQTDMLFTGTLVSSGRGAGIVVATGARTQLGEISALVRRKPPRTPLQKLTHSLERRIGVVVLISVVFVFAAGLVSGYSVSDMFRVAVALAVAAIPESLPIIFTVAMSVGVSRMARRGAIVRTLPAVETLGSTTVIASDKTGTLTENRLTVERLWTMDGDIVPGEATDQLTMRLLRAGALTNEAGESARGDLAGDAVDVAMASVALTAGAVSAVERARPPEHHVPYEPARRYSLTVVREPDGARMQYVKGAPEVVGALCESLAVPGGTVPYDVELVMIENARLSRDGLRVIAVAERVLPPDAAVDAPPSGMTLLGLEGMDDPPRAGVADAVAECRSAGIAVKMITGDHPETAQAIARRLGIATDRPPVTGAEMAELDDRVLTARLEEAGVAARVAPGDKLRIVEVLQRGGETVAATGDGVNDAPALRAASVGVAMGRGGTDVARDAADLVLTDDDFTTIVEAVEQGRVTFGAIRKATFFLLSTALAAVFALSANVLIDQPLLFLPVQMIWINLVTTGIQDIALALEPGEGDELARPPRGRREGVLSRVLWARTAVTGVWMGLVVLAVFAWSLNTGADVDHARTLAMATFVLLNFYQVGNARAERTSLVRLSPLRNKALVVTAALAVGVMWAVTVWEPAAALLEVTPLSLLEWAGCAAVAASVLVLVEAEKFARWLLLRRRRLVDEMQD